MRSTNNPFDGDVEKAINRHSSKSLTAAYWLVGLFSLSASVTNVAPILTDKQDTEKVLEMNGFTPVDVGGGVWGGGEVGEFWRTKFTATNINGETVTGYATHGVFKGTTLRFEAE